MAVTHDVIIAGGGVAGCAAAAALAQLNQRVLIVEPGVDSTRRLAGELIHPPGVADLRALGLLDCVEKAGAVPVYGFAVFAGRRDVLSYAEVSTLKNAGLAIEHGALTRALLETVERLPNVTICRGGRVTALDLSRTDVANVSIDVGGKESRLRTNLVIAADGRSSHVRRMAGIADKRVHLSNMVGFLLNHRHGLPHPAYGHVLADGPAPVLAYGIAAHTTRVMLDVPVESRWPLPSETMETYIAALPESLRGPVEEAAATQQPLISANYSIIPETVVKGRLVCVGDAAGCCHPLTATGLSACARDAVRLKRMLEDTAGHVGPALGHYASQREGPHRTRMIGAEVLYEVLKAATPEMYLLRQGLLRYWQSSKAGRARTIALLSTHDDRLSTVIREYLQVYRHAVPDLIRFKTRSRAMVGLSRALVKFLRGIFEREISYS